MPLRSLRTLKMGRTLSTSRALVRSPTPAALAAAVPVRAFRLATPPMRLTVATRCSWGPVVAL
eukprot:7905518-Lingulodinium_polyedra.AAC.1